MNVGRYFGPKLRPFGNLSKPVALKSPAHLEWIREQPCIVSGLEGQQIISHHVQRKSHGLNDYLTVPLTHEIHTAFHTETGPEVFEEKHSMDFKDAMLAKLCERVMELEKELRMR